MRNLLIHPKTKEQLQMYLKRPSGSILITGTSGSGKGYIASFIGHKILGLDTSEELSSYPYYFQVKRESNKKEISVDQVREIVSFIKLKSPGKENIRRLVLIENADSMSVEAQNAILKTLEEPNSDTAFILTATYEKSLLPTIVSRCQKIEIYPVTQDQALNYHGSTNDKNMLIQAWKLSQGAPGLFVALIGEWDNHPLKIAIGDAKQFIRSSTYERSLFFEKSYANKEKFLVFIEAMTRVLAALSHSLATKDS